MTLQIDLMMFRVCAGVATLLCLLATAACPASGSSVTASVAAPVKIGDGVDVTGDGKPDGQAVDDNGDGIPDAVDLDGDGHGDVGLPPGLTIDSNGDGKADGTTVDSDGDGMADGIDLDGDGKADVTFGGERDAGVASCVGTACLPPALPSCDTALELQPATTNVMFLVDGSSSMEAYWTHTRQAIADIVNENPTLNFGVHTFSAEGSDLGSFIRALNACGDTIHDRVEVGRGGLAQGQLIVDRLGSAPPGAGGAFFDRSPVLEALDWYLQNDSPLNDPRSANFLIVFSDFVDTCFGTLFSNPGAVSNGASGSEQLLAFEKLAVELRKRHIRVIPMGFDGDPSNNGSAGAAGDVNMEALAAITKYGGTTITAPLLAASPDDVKRAIEQIGVAVQPCRFTLPDAAAGRVNTFELTYLLDGKPVARDRTKRKGWDFVDGNTSEIEFFGSACQALQAKPAALTVREDCSREDVCGVGATQVSHRTQAVHILLDGSGSMQGGARGWFDALFRGALTPWGEATSAIAQMVVDPANDNVDFGFQFFPASAEGGCGDVGAPEVPVNPGTAIAIIDQLLSNVPNGSTPLVEALQYVASNPGRLVEKDVLSSVLLISDGGDSCAEAGQRNQLLASAAASLQTRGVDVYAVKFDSGSSDTAQETQLNNIAINGGTAPSAAIPGNPSYVEGTPAYLDAPDGQSLTSQLRAISNLLPSCELRIGQPPASADPAALNVYLNGVPIPFDSQGKRKAGWGWISDVSKGDFTRLEMFGQDCAALKNNRLNDIVIEFGCAILVVE